MHIILGFTPGNRIPLIENLGSTEDQFDTLNLCDNEVSQTSETHLNRIQIYHWIMLLMRSSQIGKLDNFPKLMRLKTLLCW